MAKKPPLTDLDKKFWIALEKVLVGRLVETTPVRTGFASGEWEVKPMGKLKYQLINHAEYTGVLEEGSDPHIIRAKNKKFLKFKKKGAKKSGKKIPGNIAFEKDGYIFAKAVFHPGTEGRFFVKKALDDQQLWDEIFSSVLG